MKGELNMGKQKKMLKLSFCLGLLLVFVFSAVTVYAAGLSAEQVKQRLEKFRGKSLVIVSWGGSFQEAQSKAFFQPFAEEFGIKVVEDSPSSPDKIMAMVKAKNVTWDVVDLGSSNSEDLGRKGFLEPIDYSIVDKTDLVGKFAGEYGVGTITFSTVLAYRTDVAEWKGSEPTSVADFWNVEKFPGRRAIRDRPLDNLVFALVALGYPYDKIYPLTDEKLEKAYKKLDELKPHITTWWTAGAQPAQLLADKEVVMASAWNGRVEVVKREGIPIKLVWNGAQLQGDSFHIPKGSPNKELAMLFIAWQALPENNWKTSQYISYGPVNRKAFPKVADLYKGSLPSDFVDEQVPMDFEWVSYNFLRMLEMWREWKLK
jgi:putative spermidine/putrescine transport system substrate-binding protein